MKTTINHYTVEKNHHACDCTFLFILPAKNVATMIMIRKVNGHLNSNQDYSSRSHRNGWICN